LDAIEMSEKPVSITHGNPREFVTNPGFGPGRLKTTEAIRALAGPAVPLLVEAAVDIAAEFYMAWRIDDVAQAPVLMFSPA
ncbi:hypothetical protein ABTK92_20645, partial [Acinetobacter baumannii]